MPSLEQCCCLPLTVVCSWAGAGRSQGAGLHACSSEVEESSVSEQHSSVHAATQAETGLPLHGQHRLVPQAPAPEQLPVFIDIIIVLLTVLNVVVSHGWF
jgi:hypothetical protein